MTETGRDVERLGLRELLGVVVDADTPEERDEAWSEIERRHDALRAVVEAAQEYREAENRYALHAHEMHQSPPKTSVEWDEHDDRLGALGADVGRAKKNLDYVLAALHSQASDEGKP